MIYGISSSSCCMHLKSFVPLQDHYSIRFSLKQCSRITQTHGTRARKRVLCNKGALKIHARLVTYKIRPDRDWSYME